MPKPTGKIYIIEGAIGAGKSSFVDATREHADAIFGPGTKVVVIKETVYYPFLDLCLKDPKRMAFPFQVCMARDRIETMRTAVRYYARGCVVLIDRGLPGDVTFAKLHAEAGNISDTDMGVYFGMISHGIPTFLPQKFVDGYEVPDSDPSDVKVSGNFECSDDASFDDKDVSIVYLKTSPLVAFSRMVKRGIKEETEGYTISWFEKLCSAYDEVVDLFVKEWTGTRVRVVDYNEPRSLFEGNLLVEDCCKAWDEIRKLKC